MCWLSVYVYIGLTCLVASFRAERGMTILGALHLDAERPERRTNGDRWLD